MTKDDNLTWTKVNTSLLWRLKVPQLQELAVAAITWHARQRKISVKHVSDIPSRKADLITFLDEARAGYWEAVHRAPGCRSRVTADRAGMSAARVNEFLRGLPPLPLAGEESHD